MNENQKEKLKKFANDKAMSESVYALLLNSFLKKRAGQDVYQLAASRLSVDFLTEAWRDLDSYKEVKEEISTGVKQVGV